jgi:NAD(P)-dependent dehydrogenase (short-subunit alcohol dehydrogenase family)
MKFLRIIIEFGTGVGFGIARAFANAGFQLGLIARNLSKYADAISVLSELGIESAIACRKISNNTISSEYIL